MRKYHFLLMALVAVLFATGCATTGYIPSDSSIRQKELWLKNGNQRIYGILLTPAGVRKAPLAVVSHGIAGNYKSGIEYAESLVKLGYAVYCFDFRGGSNSSRSDGRTTDMSIFTEEDDLRAVVEGLKGVKGIKKGKVTLLGISQGGMVSALYAGDHPEAVEKLVLVYPAFCIKDDWVTKYPKITDMPETENSFGMKLGRAYVKDLYDLDVYGRISNYKGRVLIVHGDKDRLVPISYSKKANRAYRRCTLKTIQGAGHGFRGSELTKAIEYVNDFLD